MKYRKITRVFTALSFVLLSFRKTLACQCEPIPICEAYSKAKKVFTGKLNKVIEDKTAPYYTVQAHFSVNKTFKGKTDKIEIVTFELGDCQWIDFKDGEEYFVYAEDLNINTYCNRTVILSNAKPDLEYANTISESSPIFSITGQIYPYEQLSINDLKKIKLFIKSKGGRKEVKIDKNGFFNFVARKKQTYEVNLLLPFKADISFMQDKEPPPNKVSKSTLSTKVQYDLQFKPNDCDFRIISIAKKD